VTCSHSATRRYGYNVRRVHSIDDISVHGVTVAAAKSIVTTCNTIASDPVVVLPSSSHGFEAGDPVVVTTKCDRGVAADGVGGTWPSAAAAHPDEATVQAQPAGSLNDVLWATDTGRVYYWDGAAWTAVPSTNGRWYYQYVCPLALLTTVASVDGVNVTLADAPAVNYTSATIAFNCAPAYRAALPDESPYTELTIPAGTWYFADTTGFAVNDCTEGVRITGAGEGVTTIVRPNGFNGSVFTFADCTDVEISDLTIQGNPRDDGGWAPVFTTGDTMPPAGNTSFLGFQACTDCEVRDVTTYDPFGNLMSISALSQRVYGRRITGYRLYPLLAYFGTWDLAISGSSNDCWYVDCVLDSDTVFEGFEAFGTDDCGYVGLTTRNAIGAMNGSQNWLIDGWTATIEAGSTSGDPNDQTDQIFNHNNSTSRDPSEVYGGQITNTTITIEGDPSPTDQVEHAITRYSGLLTGLTGATYGPGLAVNGNGFLVASVSAVFATPQDVYVNGLVTDTEVRVYAGSVANTEAPSLVYASNTTTLGSGNDIDSYTDVDA